MKAAEVNANPQPKVVLSRGPQKPLVTLGQIVRKLEAHPTAERLQILSYLNTQFAVNGGAN